MLFNDFYILLKNVFLNKNDILFIIHNSNKDFFNKNDNSFIVYNFNKYYFNENDILFFICSDYYFNNYKLKFIK